MATAPDRRVRRTRTALQSALVALMTDKDYEAITVPDIIDRADVGRSTFYTHYIGKDELLQDSFARLRSILEQPATTESAGRRPLSFSLPLFAHVHDQQQLAPPYQRCRRAEQGRPGTAYHDGGRSPAGAYYQGGAGDTALRWTTARAFSATIRPTLPGEATPAHDTADPRPKENDAMAAAPTRDVARWRLGLFRGLAALFAVFQLFNIGNLLAPWDANPALALTGLAAPDVHLWHAALPGAVRLLLTGGVAAALLVHPASKPLLVQWLILSAAITVGIVVPFAGLPPLLFIVLPTVLVVAAYPWPSTLASVRVTRIDRPLAALTTLAAAALAPSVWQNLTRQLDNVGGEHATEAHWALDAAHVILLLAAGALASTRRTGWQTLAILTGVTFLYLGIAAIAIPEQAGSWGTLGGALGVIAGVAYLIAGIARRSSSQPVERRPFGPPIRNQDA